MAAPESSLADRFPLRTHHFSHGEFSVELIAPRSPDELIDTTEFNVDERLPYWAELWPSARGLAMELLEMPLPAGRVLELGCGIALPSLALRHRGVEVVASDYYSVALEFALANALRNDIPPPDTLLLDWRDPDLAVESFRLVVAADVLYERRNAETLSMLLPRVTTPGGRVLVADPGRAYLPYFRQLVVAAGWRMEEISQRFVEGPAPGRDSRIHLLSLRR